MTWKLTHWTFRTHSYGAMGMPWWSQRKDRHGNGQLWILKLYIYLNVRNTAWGLTGDFIDHGRSAFIHEYMKTIYWGAKILLSHEDLSIYRLWYLWGVLDQSPEKLRDVIYIITTICDQSHHADPEKHNQEGDVIWFFWVVLIFIYFLRFFLYSTTLQQTSKDKKLSAEWLDLKDRILERVCGEDTRIEQILQGVETIWRMQRWNGNSSSSRCCRSSL